MDARRPLTRRLALLSGALLAVAAQGCSGPTAPESGGPDAVALALFDLARIEEPGPGVLDRTFGPPKDGDHGADLLDSLSMLSVASEPRVERVQPLEGLDRVAVDLVAELPGDGSAAYTVQFERGPREDWIVVWFAGPDVEWPAPDSRRGPSLSTRGPAGDPG